ncbi:hypothetical protein NEOLEDRAFT_1139541 [Neolentinus lepideus HHB14362 ss-1]|uniref:Uncharacterized protein n=1 Tax=Neolentinus lepideus HHB14362 ss-1 TaxID=1314782 RepID=A0A165PSF8_9AGAM|nr:hypothetical protein NEOLEDRAFT_1139541 [Neolentinus lepideus HHB14362 ss-1]
MVWASCPLGGGLLIWTIPQSSPSTPPRTLAKFHLMATQTSLNANPRPLRYTQDSHVGNSRCLSKHKVLSQIDLKRVCRHEDTPLRVQKGHGRSP